MTYPLTMLTIFQSIGRGIVFQGKNKHLLKANSKDKEVPHLICKKRQSYFKTINYQNLGSLENSFLKISLAFKNCQEKVSNLKGNL